MTATLFMTLELGSKTWKPACAVAHGKAPRSRTITAWDLATLWREISLTKTKLQLSVDAPVRSCYEAGRDGFWVHRALTGHGVLNLVVDPSSIAVDRRQRRVKTDRIDARALVTN